MVIDKSTRNAQENDFNDVILQISELVEKGEVIDWPALFEKHPKFVDDLRKARPVFEGLIELGRNPESSTSFPMQPAKGLPQAQQPLGDFQVLREIGRGGMGVVYEAQQLSIDRRVALKVLPLASLINHRALQRFKNEVKAIATLNHPHIVSIYSVGEERGIHYYAMELVPGQSLAAVIKEIKRQPGRNKSKAGHSLLSHFPHDTADSETVQHPPNGTGKEHDSTSTNLVDTAAKAGSRTKATKGDHAYFRNVCRLMITAADALQYAHDHGIVHRDIKPGNLLIDTKGNIFVTDFGLARIEKDVAITMTGEVIGTLRYMSPEQILGNRVIVDQRTDVYSLGATLYELLTLQPIWTGDDRPELIKKISFEEPIAPRKILPSLPQDLETIVVKSIQKNPAERYQSARELAEDLERFLDSKPILAKRVTAAQRIAKWSRRNPAIVWAGVLLMLVTSIGSAVGFALIWRANTNTENALAAATKSNAEAQDRLDESEAIVQFLLNDLLRTASPTNSLGNEITVLEALHKAEQKLDESFNDRPRIKAAIMHSMAETFHSLGEEDKALEFAEKAFEIRKQCLGDEARDTLRSKDLVGDYLGGSRAWKAREMHQQVYDVRVLKFGPNDPDTLKSMFYLAQMHAAQGDLVTAESMHSKTLEAQLRILGEGNRATNVTRLNLGNVLARQRKYEEAKNHYRRLLSIAVDQGGPDHPLALTVQNNIGLILNEQNRNQEALEVHAEVLTRKKRIFGIAHPQTLGSLRNYVASATRLGQFDDAHAAYASLIADLQSALEKEPGKASFRYALYLCHLRDGSLFRDEENSIGEQQAMNNALETIRSLTKDFSDEPLYREKLADALFTIAMDMETDPESGSASIANASKAETLFRESIEHSDLLITELPEDSLHRIRAAKARTVLSRMLIEDLARANEALPLLKDAIVHWRWATANLNDVPHIWDLLFSEKLLRTALSELEGEDEVREQSANLVQFLRSVGAKRPENFVFHSQVPYVMMIYGPQDQWDFALEFANAAKRLRPDSTDSWGIVGGIQYRRGEYAPAIQALERCLEISPDNHHASLFLAMAYWQHGDKELAKEVYSETLTTLQSQHLGNLTKRWQEEAASLIEADH